MTNLLGVMPVFFPIDSGGGRLSPNEMFGVLSGIFLGLLTIILIAMTIKYVFFNKPQYAGQKDRFFTDSDGDMLFGTEGILMLFGIAIGGLIIAFFVNLFI